MEPRFATASISVCFVLIAGWVIMAYGLFTGHWVIFVIGISILLIVAIATIVLLWRISERR